MQKELAMKMKRKYLRYGFMIILMVCAFAFLASCGPSGGGGDSSEEQATQEESAAAVLDCSANPSSINPGESTTVTATVYDVSGSPMSGVTVTFALSDPTLAYITSQASTSSSGEAEATFVARNDPGTVEVTATTGSVSNSDDPLQIVILDQSAPETINLSVSPDSISVQATATITAQVLDANGASVPNGTTVSFDVNSFYGTVSPSSTTNSGIATATFTAGDDPGTATINVSSGAATAAIDVEIQQSPAAAIEFSSAEPQCIALAGTGGTETSVIKFLVVDSNDNPLSDESVSFHMVGPGGGEYVNPLGPPFDEIDVSTDQNGIAQVILHSGHVAGPVTISATIDVSGTPMTTLSSVVSIGGGVPNAKRFSVASTLLNLPGLVYNNRTADITAYLADRFGNYNVLEGTTISFATEVGLAIDTSQVTLGDDGLATVTVRTQQPIPPNVGPEDVEPEVWEVELQDYLTLNYGYTTTAHPRDGLGSILVYVRGEEHFDDPNGNGIYDAGEPFDDTDDDPFIDYNDNDDYDGPASSDPEELYIDSQSDGSWDGENGAWDDDKNLFANFPILITGSPIILFNPTTFVVNDGGSELVNVIVCDRNLNQLPSGSKVSISADKGKLVGEIEREYCDSNALGPTRDAHLSLIEYNVLIYDTQAGDAEPPQLASITVEVEWEDLTYKYSILGTVD